MQVRQWPVEKPKPYAGNPRNITDKAVVKVAQSLKDFGFQQPIVVDKDGVVIVGHTRLLAAKSIGLKKVPVLVADLSPAKTKAYRIADNRTGEEAEWNEELLRKELEALEALGEEDADTGFDDDELAKLLRGETDEGSGGGAGSLAAQFGVPPFTVLNAKSGVWQARKDAWLALGFRSEEGRGTNLLKYSDSVRLDGEAYNERFKGKGKGKAKAK